MKIKVEIEKIGKRITWGGMTLTTPAKFYIESNEKLRFQVMMKQNGISEKEYKLIEVKEPTKGIVEANKKVEKQIIETSKELSNEVKKVEAAKEEVAVKKDEPKKDEPKPEMKIAAPVKKEEPKKK